MLGPEVSGGSWGTVFREKPWEGRGKLPEEGDLRRTLEHCLQGEAVGGPWKAPRGGGLAQDPGATAHMAGELSARHHPGQGQRKGCEWPWTELP